MPNLPESIETERHSAGVLLRVFLRLGLTSFGGPIAHLGYFRTLFVERKRWMTDEAFVDLVALCQFLPGPASSQVAFGIGLKEAGVWGGVVAWGAFTLPSAVLMFLFAIYAGHLGGPVEAAMLHGLKVVAVSVVAHAVWSMARTQAPDFRRLLLAASASVFSLLVEFTLAQPLLIVMRAVAGLAICRPNASIGHDLKVALSNRLGIGMLASFGALFLLALPAVSASLGPVAMVFGAFYRSGALVFGGGHVVLPLLQTSVVAPGWVSSDAFLAGYGAAQALPGPLFSISAYLGAMLNHWPNGLVGALVALLGISLPGLLLVGGVLPFWDRLRTRGGVQAAVQGVNATVVGILAAALYNPLWLTGITTVSDAIIAAIGWLLLASKKVPVLLMVILVAALASISSGISI